MSPVSETPRMVFQMCRRIDSLRARVVATIRHLGRRTRGKFEWRPVLFAVAMTVFVATFEDRALGLGYPRYLVELQHLYGLRGLGLHLAGALAICSAQALFFWTSFVSPLWWRVFYLCGFALITFIEYGYVKATGALTNGLSFATAITSVKYVPSMAATHVNWLAGIAVAVYALSFMAMRPRDGGHLRRFLVLVSLTAALHATYGLVRLARGDVGPLLANASIQSPIPGGTTQAFGRSLTSFVWDELAGVLSGNQRQIVSYRESGTPSNNVVLVIDESVQADRLSVYGYERPTTPWLQALRRDQRLTVWPVAASIAPVTDPSVLGIFTGIRALPDRERRAFSQPTIFQFAKAMNYVTHMFDAQLSRPRFGISWADLGYVDDFRGNKLFGYDHDADFRMARAARKILEAGVGQFVVVLKQGNHLPYHANYPKGEAQDWPTNAPVDAATDAADSIDPYDKGIRYNIDRFFRELLGEDGSLSRTVVLYTSDHGQTYGGSWDSHAVPLLMFGEIRPRVCTGYRPSHVNIFPTLLDLMGFPEQHRPVGYARSLLHAHSSDRDIRLVLNGDLFGRESFTVHDFDAMTGSRVASAEVSASPCALASAGQRFRASN